MKAQAQRGTIARNSMLTLQDWLNERSIRRGEFVNVHRVYVLVLFKMQPLTLKRHAYATIFQGILYRLPC
ncbi:MULTISPECIES: hypothetical protein [Brucella/Ochrobactrum group]|jgi:hypothetical protein|uniref:Uncharacterized protein n=1 Tax=Brucella pseudintermedia TaxID=370111 RepID=A0ABY5UBG7_9HYPH|nr:MULTISPECIES: hypothetical protein [Brucella/Ochrobactrum group]KAB2684086.1 hypothetical protein F9K78_05910 [Brucella pseudintermedia]MCO7725767.1 hypothetical protein [Brucella intermedia]NKE77284.1 hypothetical protein [Ochrobactrum sp. MC-1LL]TWH02610.1 hypothetical protein L614_001700000490 [Ochrobactrum sp. J50]UWL60686.1 hypothetical protein NIK97_02685 [Brucella pseudintermedia]